MTGKKEKSANKNTDKTLKAGKEKNGAGEYEKLLEELKEAREESGRYLDQIKRLRAEYENYRKRMERVSAGSIDSGMKNLAYELLTVLDNFERALSGDEVDRDGVDLINRELRNVLNKKGLEKLDSEGEVFDHNLHHAVGYVESEGREGCVTEVLQPGYLWKGELLRPAMVIVSKEEEGEDIDGGGDRQSEAEEAGADGEDPGEDRISPEREEN